MRTAIDTNVISGLWSREPLAGRISEALAKVREQGALVISPVVYAEISANPKSQPALLHRFLNETRIEVEFALSEQVWREVAVRFSGYAARRRASRGGFPKRLLADFIVAAHALVHADRLLTLDSGASYRHDFPELSLLTV